MSQGAPGVDPASAPSTSPSSDHPQPRRPASPPPLLEGRGLRFGYGVAVLRGVDVEVGAGECIALLGPNGAGKTTLLRLLAGLYAPWRGEVRIAGRRPSPSARGSRRGIGYLPQRIPAGNGFAVYEIVLMGRYGLLPVHTWESAREWRAVVRALRRVDAGHLLRRRFAELSGGEQRRVLLARALVAQPRLLLLDEPLASLDPGFSASLRALLRRLKSGGIGLVLATHDLGLAVELADRAVLMRGGRVVAQGPPGDIMTGAALNETYGTTFFEPGPVAVASASAAPAVGP